MPATCNPQPIDWYKFTSWLIVVSLLLPARFLTAPTPLYAQAGVTVDSGAPFSEVEAAIGLQPQYSPTFDPLPEPESIPVAQAVEVNRAAVEENIVDPESLKSGIVAGVASVQAPADGSQITLGNLQLGLRRTDIPTDVQASGSQTRLDVTAEVLPVAVATQLSPIGFAFKLSTSGNELQAASGVLPFEVSIDYSQIPIRHGGGFVQRMHLYRVTKCDAAFVCREVKELADVNDTDNRRLVVDLASFQADEEVEIAGQKGVELSEEFANLRSTFPSAGETIAIESENNAATEPTVPAIQGENQVFLPLVASSDDTADEVYYVVMAAAQYPNGNYTATPLTGVSQYDVSLQTGTAESSYPIQIPPAAAGLAPQVSLNYNSGAVDGLSSMRNSQGSWAGVASQTVTYTYSTPTGHVAEEPLPPQVGSIIYIYYSDFRGSEVVTETFSDGTKIEHRFYRGLYGDGYADAPLDTTSARTKITLSDGTQRTDYNWVRGREVETRVLSITGTLLSRVVNNFVYTQTDGGTANTRYGAYFVATDSSDQITPSSGGNKTVRAAYTYDAYGNLLRQILHGDTSTTSDDRTIQNTYVYSTTNGGYQVNRMSKQVLWSGALTTTNGTAGQEKSIAEYLYDGSTTVGTAPTKGNLTASRSYSTTTAYNQTSTTYDALGRPLIVTDARGKNTSTSYHAFYGYATAITNSLGHVSTSIVDPRWGVITQTVDANLKVTNLKYDDFGRLQKVWLPSELTTDPASLEFEYHPEARPAWVKTRTLQVKASSSYLQSWVYVDGFGRELQSQSAVATGGRSITSKKYNSMGQLLYASAAYADGSAPGSNYLGVSNWATVANYSQNYYDGLGRVVKRETRSTSNLLWSTQAQYDGWLTASFDANNRKIEQSADAFGKTVKVTEYNVGNVAYNTLYNYDLQGNLTRVTDTLGNSTVITYNLRGQKSEMLDPDMGLWQYEYDGNGNLVMQQDALNRKLYLSYDDLNRLTAKRKDTAGGSLIADYSFDASGQKGLLNKSRSFQSNGSTVDVEIQNVTYDARNRLTQQNTIVASGGTFRFDTAYNEADQKKTLTYPGGNGGTTGEVVSYAYNAVGQLSSVSGLAGIQYVSSASYNAQGQMLTVVNENGNGANGLTRQMGYESNTLRLSTIKAGTASPWESLQKLSYQYDNVGNVKTLTDTINSGQVQTFGYDWLNRLVTASTNAVGTGQYNQTYIYDAIGNISNFAGNGFTYGSKPHAVTAAYGNSYGYDANGNQTTRTIGTTVTQMIYDYENRLTEVKEAGVTKATFVYDASGQRVKGTIGTVTTIYIGGIYEYQAGATTLYYEGNALRRTGYAADNGVKYLLQDHLKSSSAIASQTGVVTAADRNYYLPFGGKRGTAAFSGLTTKRFTGQYHEASLPGGEGLSYYGARWYDAKLGRFLSADTIVPGAGNPQAFNRYSYVLNRPTGMIDPTGHDPCDNGSRTCNSLNSDGGANLSTAENTYVRLAARKFSLPFKFLAAVVHTQKEVDYTFADRFEDNSVKNAIYLVRSHEQYLKTLQQFPYAQSPGSSQGMGGSAFLGHSVLYTATILDSSLGIGQVRISTAQRMEERYTPSKLLSKSVTPLDTIEKLEAPDTNIEYIAAYLRYLTDVRVSDNRSNFDSLTVTDMQIIYGAYRAGIEKGYGSESQYQEASKPGEWGSLLHEDVIALYE